MRPPPQQTLLVAPKQAGARLMDLLQQSWPELRRVYLRRLVAAGLVLVNGQVELKPERRLRADDVVMLPQPDAGELRAGALQEDEMELGVLHEDDELLVVDKPAGMHSVPDRGGKYRGVHGRLDELRPGEDLRIVHRLDRDTSGCMMLAKGLEAARRLDRLLQERQVHKRYVALVVGRVRFEERRVDRHLGPDTRRPGRVRVVAADKKGSREAITLVERLEAFAVHTLVAAKPETGRAHQIRVHLAHLGHPIVADSDYGVGGEMFLSELKRDYKIRRGVVERPLLSRMFLHAAELRLPDPTGDEIVATAPLPKDLETVLDKLRRFSPAS